MIVAWHEVPGTRRGYSTQPRVSTLGILHHERRALKGRLEFGHFESCQATISLSSGTKAITDTDNYSSLFLAETTQADL
jgi:hypothetical protein